MLSHFKQISVSQPSNDDYEPSLQNYTILQIFHLKPKHSII